MIEIKGKYNTASIYTDSIEDEAYKQVLNLMNQKFAEGSTFAIMPDCHAGAGRLMSRSKAKETLDMDEFTKSMHGIYTTCIDAVTDKVYVTDQYKEEKRIAIRKHITHPAFGCNWYWEDVNGRKFDGFQTRYWSVVKVTIVIK